MSRFNDFKRGGISFGTQYIDKLFTPSVQYNVTRGVNKDVLEEFLKVRDSQPAPFNPSKNKRSFLDRGFDLLSIGNYTFAGGITEAQQGGNFFKGFWEGAKAGNPFGKGNESGEKTWKDVLKGSGWEDDAFTGSNFARGTAGFALDVLLDPTTYMTFGLGAIAKGTGLVGRGAKAVEELASKYPEFAQSIKESGGLSRELAEEIVLKSNGITDPKQLARTSDEIGNVTQHEYKLSRDQLDLEVEELVRTYNKLMGVGRKSEGITVGVTNMPFGDYIAQKLNLPQGKLTIAKGDTIQKIGDKVGTAHTYSAIRNSIYGAKVGRLLSNNAGLKVLAEKDPSKLFEFTSAVAKLQGKDLDKLAREKHIKQLGEDLLELTPADQKKIIQALENPKLWQRATEIIKGAGTPAWTKLQDDYKAIAETARQEAQTLSEITSNFEKASVEQLSKYQEELRSLDLKEATTSQKNIVKEIEGNIATLIERKGVLQAGKQTKDYDSIIKELEKELQDNLSTYSKMADEVVTGVESQYLRLTSDELNNIVETHLSKTKSFDDEMANIKEMLRHAGKGDAQTVGQYATKQADSKELQKWMHNAKLGKEASINDLRKMVSEYLFGRTDGIPKNIDAGKLESLARSITNVDEPERLIASLDGQFGGTSILKGSEFRDDTVNFIMESDDLLASLREIAQSESLVADGSREIFSYLAKKFNYRAISDVYERLNTLSKELRINKEGKPGIKLTTEQQALYAEFRSLSDKVTLRNLELKKIMAIESPKARLEYVKALRQSEERDELYNAIFSEVDADVIRHERLVQMSDTREQADYAGTKYNRKLNIEADHEADAIGQGFYMKTKDEIELERFRDGYNGFKYKTSELADNSLPDFKNYVARKRQVSLFQNELSDSAKQLLTKMGELSKANDQLKHRRGVEARRKLTENSREINTLRNKLNRETNYNDVLTKANKIEAPDTRFFDTQAVAYLHIHEAMFPYHKFADLTSKQKSMLNGIAYSATKNYIAKNGTPSKADYDKFRDFINKEHGDTIHKKVQEVISEQEVIKQAWTVRDKVSYGSGVEFKVGDEILRGTVTSLSEEKRPIYRERVDVKEVTEGEGTFITIPVKKPKIDKKTKKPILDKNGNPVMREVLENKYVPPVKTRVETRVSEHLGDEGTGVFNYTIKGVDGTEHTVKAGDIVGTYVDDFHFETVTLPRYTADEIERVSKEISTLKRKIAGSKGAKARAEKANAKAERIKAIKLDKLQRDYEQLITRKIEAEKKLFDLSKMEDSFNQKIKAVERDLEDFYANKDQTLKEIDALMAKANKIERALDDDEVFEMMAKLDAGDRWENFLESSKFERQTDDLVIDTLENWDKHLVDYAKKLRHDFTVAGLDEVAVGKLDQGALEKMMDSYFPRSLSDEGKAYFDANPDLIDKYGAVAREYGFGKEFSSHTKSRSDETRFESLFKLNNKIEKDIGIRVFEENLGKAYINRMLTSTELVYDQRAMTDIMVRFGKEIQAEPRQGYTTVLNYGNVKKFIFDVSLDKATTYFKELRKEAIRDKARAEKRILEKFEIDELLKGEQFGNEAFQARLELEQKKIIDLMGLSEDMLNGNTTPFIKIENHKTAISIQNLADEYKRSDIIRDINTATIDRANQARQLFIERDESQLLTMYDKFMTFFKLNQTTVSPAFHVRNHLGAMFVGWLGVGREALKLSNHKEAYQALQQFGNPIELRKLRPLVTDNPSKVYHQDEIMELASSFRVIDEGFMMKDFDASSYSQGTRVLPGKLDPFNTKEFLPYKIGSKVATYSDNINRLVQFKALLKMGKTPYEASEIVRKYMFDYSDLTTFEKRVMKRIFPYYTYMRKNIPMMSKEFLDNPEKMQMIAKIHNGIDGMTSDEDHIGEQEKMGFAQDWLQMPFNLGSMNGQEPVLLNPAMPYMQLGDISMEGDIGEQAKTLFSQSAPMLKVPIELATNWNSFFDSPIVELDEEGRGSQVSPRLAHVASQLFAFSAVKNFIQAKTGDDKVLALLNSATGVKMTTYDIEGAREKIMEDAYKDSMQLTVKNVVGYGVQFGKNLLDVNRELFSDMAISLAGKPFDAFEAEGVLSPVSITTYAGLSDKDKKKYTFDDETKAYVNRRAVEFEQEQFEKTGVFKKFMWTLIDDEFAEKSVVTVDRVKDGDTFVARRGDETFDVRLLLVDTPESVGAYKDNPMAYGKEASEFTSELILGKDVKLYIDSNTTYGRKLAFVEVGGKSVQEELLRQGYGKVRQYDDNFTDQTEDLYNIEEEAYKNKRNVWKDGTIIPRSNSGF